MADTPEPFTPETTRGLALEASATIGHAGAGVEFLRLGENAIYRITGTPIVVRLGRSLGALADVRKEIRVARWLEEAGVPAVRLSDETGDEPLIVAERHPVTFWRYVDARPPAPELRDLGRLLRLLHDLERPAWLALPKFYPFVRVADRLERAPAAANPDDVAFLSDLFTDLQERYEQLCFEFPLSPVHGDAHLANLMRDASGEVLLLDFEAFSYGHREWDLTVTGIRRQGFAWLDDAQYATFTDAYGYDVLDWPGFPVFRAIRELTMTTWLMQLVDDPQAGDEFHRRVDDIRSQRFPRHWKAF